MEQVQQELVLEAAVAVVQVLDLVVFGPKVPAVAVVAEPVRLVVLEETVVRILTIPPVFTQNMVQQQPVV